MSNFHSADRHGSPRSTSPQQAEKGAGQTPSRVEQREQARADPQQAIALVGSLQTTGTHPWRHRGDLRHLEAGLLPLLLKEELFAQVLERRDHRDQAAS